MSATTANFTATGKYTGHRGAIYELCRFDKDHFLSCSGDGYIVKWKIKGTDLDGQVIAFVEAHVYALIVVREHLLVLGDMNGEVYWVDLRTQETLRRFQTHKRGVFAFYEYGGFLYSAGGDGMLTRWNLDSCYPEESIQVSGSSLRKIELFGKDQFLIAASDSHIHLVNVDKMTSGIYVSEVHEPSVFCMAIGADSIYSGGRDALIKRHTLAGEYVDEVSAHWYSINELELIASSQPLLVSASRDKKIRIWNAENLELVQSIDIQAGGHINSVNDLLYIPDQKVLLAASDDRTISRFVIN